jgi:hypothetical protein
MTDASSCAKPYLITTPLLVQSMLLMVSPSMVGVIDFSWCRYKQCFTTGLADSQGHTLYALCPHLLFDLTGWSKIMTTNSLHIEFLWKKQPILPHFQRLKTSVTLKQRMTDAFAGHHHRLNLKTARQWHQVIMIQKTEV